jgi:hypothetical protein
VVAGIRDFRTIVVLAREAEDRRGLVTPPLADSAPAVVHVRPAIGAGPASAVVEELGVAEELEVAAGAVRSSSYHSRENTKVERQDHGPTA